MTGSLKSGSFVSRYRVTSSIGAGGMGEVYRAVDPSLEREVALKILPPELVRHEDRVRRFEREAKSASSLSHPNIVHIYEIGQSEDPPVHYIAMELVEGMTLADQIHEERADLRKLVGWLAQAADALAKAHGAGIVHRDLKPDNIMISNDGFAKVLDFGVAKLIEKRHTGETKTSDGTVVPAGTREGAVVGTVGYMSPEQAMGKSVDHRSDIFSFGCMLYEAATRRRPFEASSDVDTLHRIIHEEPRPVEEINPEIPGELEKVIRRCLAKEPDRRFHSMKDVALELSEIFERPQLSPARRSRRARKTIAGVAMVFALLVLALVGLWQWRDRSRRDVSPSASAAPGRSMTIRKLTGSGNVMHAAISPDGKYIAYLTRDRNGVRLMARQIPVGNDVEITKIFGNECAESGFWRFNVWFSPDSKSIDYSCGHSQQLRVPLLGGRPRVVFEEPLSKGAFSPDGRQTGIIDEEGSLFIGDADGKNLRSLVPASGSSYVLTDAVTWSPDGNLIAAIEKRGTVIFPVAFDAATGVRTALSKTSWARVFDLAWLPDGEGVLVVGRPSTSNDDDTQIWKVVRPSGEVTRLINDLNQYLSVSVSADGRELLAVEGNWLSRVRTQPLDHSSPEVLLPSGPDHRDGFPGVAWTRDGRLIYPIQDNGVRRLWIADRDGGNAQLISSETSAVTDCDPVVSPVTGEVIFVQWDTSGKSIWKMQPDGSGRMRLSNGPNDGHPSASPTGEWITYTSFGDTGGQIRRVSLKGGTPVTIRKGGRASSISPNGTLIAVSLPNSGQIVIVPVSGGVPVQTLEAPGIDWHSGPQWLDDGRSIAYVRNDAGVYNILKQPVAGGPPVALTQLTEGTIFNYRVSPDGRWLAWSQGGLVSDVVLISDFQ
jgi:serine/threonine protein kinase